MADLIAEEMLEKGHPHPAAHHVIGMVAEAIGDHKRAAEMRRLARAAFPADQDLKQLHERSLKAVRDAALVRPEKRARYVLIKPWQAGFTSDLDHAVSALALAEVTGRTPVVYWGEGSRFRDAGVENAWESFFEPVSAVTLAELTGSGQSYFPPKWNAGNLADKDVNRIEGEHSRLTAFMLLNRRETVVVSDFHSGVVDLFPWIATNARPGSALAREKTIEGVYRHVYSTLIRLKPAIVEEIEAFAARHFGGERLIGVHIRGSDKPGEDSKLAGKNAELRERLMALAAQAPEAKIFLLTDDERAKAEIVAEYPGRVITTDAARTSGEQGLHFMEHASRSRLGVEVLKDCYLAAKCHRFIGVGSTNVACTVRHLKDWGPGECVLLGDNLHEKRNFFIHER